MFQKLAAGRLRLGIKNDTYLLTPFQAAASNCLKELLASPPEAYLSRYSLRYCYCRYLCPHDHHYCTAALITYSSNLVGGNGVGHASTVPGSILLRRPSAYREFSFPLFWNTLAHLGPCFRLLSCCSKVLAPSLNLAQFSSTP